MTFAEIWIEIHSIPCPRSVPKQSPTPGSPEVSYFECKRHLVIMALQLKGISMRPLVHKHYVGAQSLRPTLEWTVAKMFKTLGQENDQFRIDTDDTSVTCMYVPLDFHAGYLSFITYYLIYSNVVNRQMDWRSIGFQNSKWPQWPWETLQILSQRMECRIFLTQD